MDQRCPSLIVSMFCDSYCHCLLVFRYHSFHTGAVSTNKTLSYQTDQMQLTVMKDLDEKKRKKTGQDNRKAVLNIGEIRVKNIVY